MKKRIFILTLATLIQPMISFAASNGGAFLEKTQDPFHLIQNPANLAKKVASSAHIGTHFAFETTYYSAEYTSSFSGLAWGINFRSAQTPDAIKTTYDDDAERYVDTGERFGYDATLFSLATAYKPLNELAIGITVKSVTEQLDTLTGSGIGIDAGAVIDLPYDFSVNICAQNILAPSPKNFSKYPLILSAGISRNFFELFSGYIDIRKKENRNPTLISHIEINLNPRVPILIGYNDGALSAGLRLELENLAIGYAIQFPKESESFLENENYFGLSLKF
jgi:hypothetical protein